MSLVLVYDVQVGDQVYIGLTNFSGTVNWGDGSSDTSLSHTYSAAGSYTINVTGTATAFNNSSSSCIQCLKTCSSFGDLGLTDLTSAFQRAVNLTTVPTSLPSSITNTSYMFAGAAIFNQDISWNVSNVTNMNSMFSNAYAFNQSLNWNVSNVTDMTALFENTLFNKPLNWNVSNVTNMSSMFQGSQFNQDLSWNVSNVTDMTNMFQASQFNKDINSWNVSAVTNMTNMFQGSQFNKDIGSWNVSNVTNMNSMFDESNFNQDIGIWNVSNVTDMTGMFSNSPFNQNIGSWNVTNVNYMNYMLDYTRISTTNFDSILNGWGAQNVKPGITLGASGLTYSTAGSPGYNILTTTYNWTILGVTITCFKEDSKILTDQGYRLVQDLRKGDLVKTLHGFVPIYAISKRTIYHQACKDRIKDQLYKCSTDNYPVFEDLIITGCHSILVDDFKEGEREKTIKINGDAYVTTNKYRLPACVDERSSVYETPGNYTIYHFTLENDNYFNNYGVYANGLLVETCSKRYLIELSHLELV